jgi:hypothetical protein
VGLEEALISSFHEVGDILVCQFEVGAQLQERLRSSWFRECVDVVEYVESRDLGLIGATVQVSSESSE